MRNVTTNRNVPLRGRPALPHAMKKAAQFRVLLDPSTYDAFEKHVSDRGDSLSNFTRRLILSTLASAGSRTA